MMRLTPLGRVVLALATALLVAGVILAYAEVVTVGIFLFVLCVIAALLSIPPLRVEVQRYVEPVVGHRRRVAFSTMEIRNVGRGRVGDSAIFDRVSLGATITELSIAIPQIKPGEMHHTSQRLPTERRGILGLGPLIIERTDPFGLLTRRVEVGGVLRYVVRPRVLSFIHPAGGSTQHLEDGSAPQFALEGAGSFQGLREYVAGDDPRMIHWPTTARLGQLMVRKYVDIERPEIAVIMDDRAEAYAMENDAEEAVDIVASIIASTTDTTTTRFLTTSGSLHATVGLGPTNDALLDVLAEMPIADGNDDTTFRNALTKVATADSRGTAFVVTGHSATRSPLTSDEAELLRQRFRRVIVFAIGDGEPNFRRTADYELLSAASADEILTLWTSAIAS